MITLTEIKTGSIVETNLCEQAMRMAPLDVPGLGKMTGDELLTKAKRVRVNMRQFATTSDDYVVAKSKFDQLQGYANQLRAKTINNDEWRQGVIDGVENLAAIITLVDEYNVEAEFERLNR